MAIHFWGQKKNVGVVKQIVRDGMGKILGAGGSKIFLGEAAKITNIQAWPPVTIVYFLHFLILNFGD